MSVAELEPPEDDDEEETEALGQEIPATEITPARRRTRVETRELGRQLWQEYHAGMNQRQLGELHGISPRMVHYYLAQHARRYGKKDLDRSRRLDLDRIEALMDAHWKKAIDSGKVDHTKLILVMIKLRADILGYAAPKKVEHSGETRIGVSPELADLLRQRQQENQATRGELSRVTSAETDIVDAEVIDDPDG